MAEPDWDSTLRRSTTERLNTNDDRSKSRRSIAYFLCTRTMASRDEAQLRQSINLEYTNNRHTSSELNIKWTDEINDTINDTRRCAHSMNR